MRKPIYGGYPGPATVDVPSGKTTRAVAVAKTFFCGEVETDGILICQLVDGRYYLMNEADVQVFSDRVSLAEYLWADGNITWRLWQTFYDMPDGSVTLDWAALHAADREARAKKRSRAKS